MLLLVLLLPPFTWVLTISKNDRKVLSYRNLTHTKRKKRRSCRRQWQLETHKQIIIRLTSEILRRFSKTTMKKLLLAVSTRLIYLFSTLGETFLWWCIWLPYPAGVRSTSRSGYWDAQWTSFFGWWRGGTLDWISNRRILIIFLWKYVSKQHERSGLIFKRGNYFRIP